MKLYIVTYGIACIEENVGKRELVTEIPGVTLNRSEIETLVRLCNDVSLCPDYLKDVVDDLICTI